MRIQTRLSQSTKPLLISHASASSFLMKTGRWHLTDQLFPVVELPILAESWSIHLLHPRKHSKSHSAELATDRRRCSIHFSNCSAWPIPIKMRMNTRNNLKIELGKSKQVREQHNKCFPCSEFIFWWPFWSHVCFFWCSPGNNFQSCHTFLNLDPKFYVRLVQNCRMCVQQS